MKIILFGGAFNPVHNEHVAMLKAAKERLGADKVIIMPTAVSPHKSGFITAAPSAYSCMHSAPMVATVIRKFSSNT